MCKNKTKKENNINIPNFLKIQNHALATPSNIVIAIGIGPGKQKSILEKIKIKNLNRTKPIQLKNFSFKCKYCERKIPRSKQIYHGSRHRYSSKS